ncbi:MAG: hypothetical protein ABSA53_25795 [Streptosporangiaceae bacterium]
MTGSAGLQSALAGLDARPASLAEAFHAVAACAGVPVTVTGNPEEVAA